MMFIIVMQTDNYQQRLEKYIGPNRTTKDICKAILKYWNQYDDCSQQMLELLRYIESVHGNTNPFINYAVNQINASIKDKVQTPKKQLIPNAKTIKFLLTKTTKINSQPSQPKFNLYDHLQKPITHLNLIQSEEEQYQSMLNELSRGENKIVNRCLGCIDSISQKLQFHKTGQAYILMKYENINVVNSIRSCACSLLNSGGGYLFIKTNQGRQNSKTEQIRQNIEKEMSMIRFRQKFTYKIDDLCYNQKEENPENQFDIRISLASKDKTRIFYVEYKMSNNCSNQKIYMNHYTSSGQPLKIKLLNIQHFSSIIEKFYYSFNREISICENMECIGAFPERRAIINGLDLVSEVEQDEPIFKYQSCLLILVKRAKDKKTISQVCHMLKDKYIKYSYNKPFQKYNDKCTRIVYFFSVEAKFDAINNILKEKHYPNHIKGNITLISLTKYLQVPLQDQGSSFNQQESQKKIIEMLHKQLELNGMDKVTNDNGIEKIEQKIWSHPYCQKKQAKCPNIFYLFSDLKPAVFLFIILSSIGLKGYFIRDEKLYQ